MLHRLDLVSNHGSQRSLKWSALRLTSPLLVSLVALASGCGSSGSDASAAGGVAATGGATGTGGASATGGAETGGVAATGGTSALGGSGGIASGGAATGGAVSTGGAAIGGAVSTGGAATGGAISTGGAATGGAGGAVSAGGTAGGAVSTGGTAGGASGAKFSFFVTSQVAIVAVSKSDDGFGGDLTFGETGPGAGLRGADKICAAIAERGMAGAGQKTWRAFLSATDDGAGKQVNAIDRVGEGPWYDRKGRLLAMTKADLLMPRPTGADSQIINDFPNEDGVPNHAPDGTTQVDNHDILTGTNDKGELYSMTGTCKDWTSSDGATGGKPRVGHAWPRSTAGGGKAGAGGGMNNWMSALDEAGCGRGFNIVEMGGPNPSVPTVGSGGGYGAIYCFALTP